MDDKARKRLRLAMPQSRSPTPEAPNLPHLRATTPPLTAAYTSAPTINRDFTSFVLDPNVQQAFTSTHINSLQDTATELISGEAAMRKAFGGLWRVLQGDLQREPSDNEDEDEEEEESKEGEDKERGKQSLRASLRLARRGSTLPQEIQPLAHLFVSPTPVSLGNIGGIGGTGPSERLIPPPSQLETFEWCLGVLRELADHGKEYTARLEEIRNGLGQAGAVRSQVWGACRRAALEEIREGRPH